MAFIDSILEPPSYGWKDENGELIKPTTKQMLKEFLSRINIFKSKKNWVAFSDWFVPLCLLPFFILFLVKYFTWWLFIIGFVYSMILMGSHGTVWLHRYSTHKAFTFRNSFWRFVTKHLVIKVMPEETYVISHHVHHALSEKPGDPYNANGGFLYCFLADAIHQPIAKNLSEENYNRVAQLLEHTGVKPNTYAQYLEWGSIASPYRTAASILGNWIFWYTIFFLIGGHALGCTIFGSAMIWALGVRTFNYEGHGKGQDKRQDGVDFNRVDMSINQYWPGIVAGEWHNNHHLFPSSARSGFLKHQIDFAWYYVYLLHAIGGISSYHDSKKTFLEQYYNPYIRAKSAQKNVV